MSAFASFLPTSWSPGAMRRGGEKEFNGITYWLAVLPSLPRPIVEVKIWFDGSDLVLQRGIFGRLTANHPEVFRGVAFDGRTAKLNSEKFAFSLENDECVFSEESGREWREFVDRFANMAAAQWTLIARDEAFAQIGM